MFLRPDSRGTVLATRQSITSPRQSESPDSTALDDTMAWADKEGYGKRASELDDVDMLLAPHVDMATVRWPSQRARTRALARRCRDKAWVGRPLQGSLDPCYRPSSLGARPICL